MNIFYDTHLHFFNIQNNFSELSDDDEEKPWYDVQPKSTERKSKLFASSFNALEDDEDSFSYE